MTSRFYLGAILAIGASHVACAQNDLDKVGVSPTAPRAVAIEQIGRPRHGDPVQVDGRVARSVTPPSPLSTSVDGRPVAVAPLGGADRCDAERRKAEQPAICRRTIETRAEEFRGRQSAASSAEAALLVLSPRTSSPAQTAGTDGVTRSATSAADPDDRISQEVAAVTAPAPTQPDDEAPVNPTPSAASQTIGEIILDILTRQP